MQYSSTRTPNQRPGPQPANQIGTLFVQLRRARAPRVRPDPRIPATCGDLEIIRNELSKLKDALARLEGGR